MYNVGMLYHDGHGVQRNFTESIVWFRKAADAGQCFAMNGIGMQYMNG